MAMPSDNAMTFDLAHYERDGYATIPNILNDDEIREVFAQIERVFDQALAAQNDAGSPRSSLEDKYRRLKTQHPVLKSHCYDVLGQLDTVQAALSKPQLIDAGHTIYGSPLLAGYRQVRIDDQSNDRLLPMHQELELLSLFNLNIWLPLVDLDAEGGGLRVQPGSHKNGLIRHRLVEEPQRYWSVPDHAVDSSKVTTIALRAGDALIFHPFLFHGSLGNQSDRIRWTLVGRWAEIRHLPYIRDPNAKKFMDRNPDPSAPGNDFVKGFLANEDLG